MILRPADYGALGDGQHDDLPALQALAAAALAAGPGVRIDLAGTWHVSDTWTLTTPQDARVLEGEVRTLPGASVDAVVVLDLGAGTRLEGLEAGGVVTTWVANRTARTGIRFAGGNRCQIGRLRVTHTSRHGVHVPAGANVIACEIGSIVTDQTGTPGPLPAVPTYARRRSTATKIVREGVANSPAQKARVYLPHADLPELAARDLVCVAGRPYPDGGELVEVVALGSDGDGEYVQVAPWPGRYVGEGSWAVESLQGAALCLEGGDTTAVSVGTLDARYAGQGYAGRGLYGARVDTLITEVCGLPLGLGAWGLTHSGTLIGAWHPEITAADVGQLSLSVTRCRIATSTAYRPWLWHTAAPRMDSGVRGTLGWTAGVILEAT